MTTDISAKSTHADEMAINNALLADITAVRAEVVKLVTDVTALILTHNTMVTKLNADAGVTDVNYAAAAAITAVAPAALTTVV